MPFKTAYYRGTAYYIYIERRVLEREYCNQEVVDHAANINHPDRSLINRTLNEFILNRCHKTLFYKLTKMATDNSTDDVSNLFAEAV